ncbi:MAG: hypothetical protein PVJ43_03310 [Gemmatimonadales bacterium]|jgi:hypothetical protein
MRRLLPVVFAAALAVTPSSAFGQVDLGAQLSWGTDNAGLALGGRLNWVWPWEPSTSMIGSFDYFFPDGFDLWEINVNLAYSFPLDIEDFGLYGGAGMNWAHFSSLGERNLSDDKFGLNLLGGIKYFLPTVIPYGEVRVALGGAEHWVFTGGVLFDIGTD